MHNEQGMAHGILCRSRDWNTTDRTCNCTEGPSMTTINRRLTLSEWETLLELLDTDPLGPWGLDALISMLNKELHQHGLEVVPKAGLSTIE